MQASPTSCNAIEPRQRAPRGTYPPARQSGSRQS
jgi:hypothetical protein